MYVYVCIHIYVCIHVYVFMYYYTQSYRTYFGPYELVDWLCDNNRFGMKTPDKARCMLCCSCYTYIYIYMYIEREREMYIYIYIYLCICMHICIYIYIYVCRPGWGCHRLRHPRGVQTTPTLSFGERAGDVKTWLE